MTYMKKPTLAEAHVWQGDFGKTAEWLIDTLNKVNVPPIINMRLDVTRARLELDTSVGMRLCAFGDVILVTDGGNIHVVANSTFADQYVCVHQEFTIVGDSEGAESWIADLSPDWTLEDAKNYPHAGKGKLVSRFVTDWSEVER